MSFWAARWSMSRTRSTSAPFSVSSVSAILVLAIVGSFRVGSSFAKTTFAESEDGRSLCYEGSPFIHHGLGHDQIENLLFIGKESNELEDVEEGSVSDAADVYTEYP